LIYPQKKELKKIMDNIEKMRKAEELTKEATRLQEEVFASQVFCTHVFGPAEYDPDYKMEPTGWKFEHQGSDCWESPTGYQKVDVPRWSKTCIKCGKKEYTMKQKAVAFEPDFGTSK